MKTVKAKLFSGFALVIFIILSALSFISIELFSYSQESKAYTLIEDTTDTVRSFIEKNGDMSINELDKYVDLKGQFLIVLKNKRVIFTNQSDYKTKRVLKEIYEDYYEEKHHKKEHKKDDEKYIYEEGYILNNEIIEKQDFYYEIYVGIDDDIIDEDIANISFLVIILNITIFIILLVLGYVLINRTIRPLKLILEELKNLQDVNDLSNRLKQINTKDEFEELIDSFNKMLNNIENSVENIKQFSSDASHELKTPLTVIQGEIELIKNKDTSKEDMQKVLEKVDKEQKKLQEIIKNFLLLSRLEKEVFKNSKAFLDKTLFESIEENLEKIEQKNLELKLEVEDSLEIDFDEKYLSIVVNNLICNAIKYTKKGFIEIKAKKEGPKTILDITDSGIGIAKNDLERIFERFYRVDKARTTSKDGIGLGLSIVKKICQSFESKIKVESELNKGTNFKIEFKT